MAISLVRNCVYNQNSTLSIDLNMHKSRQRGCTGDFINSYSISQVFWGTALNEKPQSVAPAFAYFWC